MKHEIEKMKGRLEDIEKKEYFSTPEGYFENLPMRIQQRNSEMPQPFSIYWVPMLKYAVPMVLIVLVSYFVFFWNSDENREDVLLAEITEQEALEYLSSIEISAVDIISFAYSSEEIDQLIKAPSSDEIYQLNEELLFTPSWETEEIVYETEDI